MEQNKFTVNALLYIPLKRFALFRYKRLCFISMTEFADYDNYYNWVLHRYIKA
jgi:hypothetical protein